jgi:predicted acetyltransferase
MSNFILDHQSQSAIYQLYLYAFNAQDSAQRRAFWEDRFQHSIPYGVINDGQIETSVLSLPFETNFWGTNFKMNGISDVMSAPEASGKGGASQLMTAALQDMYTNHVTLSYLAPFAFGYYRRFGYEQVFDHASYRLASEKLPRLKGGDGIKVRRMNFNEAIELIKPIYAQSKLAQRGGLQRADWWWEYLPKKFNQRQVAVAFNDQIATGYLIYERTASDFIVYEVASLDPNSRQALWKFVTKHGTASANFIYNSPSAELDLDLIDEPYAVTTTVNPYMMARIVDLQDFLTRYPVGGRPAQFTLNVVDDVITENHGQWAIQSDGQTVQVEKTSSTVAETEVLTIQQLTKVLFGYRSLASLIEHGKVANFNTDTISNIDQFAVKQTPILADYF